MGVSYTRDPPGRLVSIGRGRGFGGGRSGNLKFGGLKNALPDCSTPEPFVSFRIAVPRSLAAIGSSLASPLLSVEDGVVARMATTTVATITNILADIMLAYIKIVPIVFMHNYIEQDFLIIITIHISHRVII